MNYRISRNGQLFGPYTEAQVRQYLAAGNITGTDLVQAEGAVDWISVLELFPQVAAPGVAPVGTPGGLYPDPPDFPWWGALLLGLITGGVFFVVWDIVQAAWLRRVQPTSQALGYYIAVGVLFLLRLPASWGTINYNLFGGPPVGPHHGFILFLVWVGLYLASRTVIRRELLQHFNGPEPIGLELNSFFVYVFGGLYLQYHFNRINEIKRAMHVSVPAF